MSEKYIKINRPSGEEQFKLITAFDLRDKSNVVLDSKLKDANQNTIVYVSRINGNNLEEIIDEVEWSDIKNTLVSIVKGTEENAVKYISVNDLKENYNSSQNVGHTLALPEKFLLKIVEGYASNANKEVMTQEITQSLEEPIVDVPIIQKESIEEENSLEQPAATPNNLEDAINRVDIKEPVNIINNDNAVDLQTNNEPITTDVPEQQITMEQPVIETANIQPIIEEQPTVFNQQPNIVEAPVNLNESSQIDVPSMEIVSEPVNIQPVIEEQPVTVTPEMSSFEPVAPIEQPQENITNIVPEQVIPEQQSNSNINTSIDFDDIESIKNNIISLCERLQAKEKELAEKEEMINAKLEIANIAYNNAQAVNHSLNSQNLDDQGQSRILAA